jgi:hypothetical protein
VSSQSRSPHRFYGKLRRNDLDRLLEIEHEWRASLEQRKEHWRLYANRLLCVCLAQGGALHVVDGKNGIKDLDVYRFFAAHPKRPQPDPAIYRGRTTKDIGRSRLGKRTDRDGIRGFPGYEGRNVDIFSVALPVRPSAEPIGAIRALLANPRTGTERALAAKAVVLIDRDPPVAVWPPSAEGTALRGYAGEPS